MQAPMHPGELIRRSYMTPYKLGVRKFAASLGVSPSTVTRLLSGESNVSPQMALRLSKVLGRTAESWLNLQLQFDLWHARQELDLEEVRKLRLSAA